MMLASARRDLAPGRQIEILHPEWRTWYAIVMSTTVTTISSRALCDTCARMGVDVDWVLEQAGLSRAQVYDPDARIPREAAWGIWRGVFEATGDSNLALHAVESLEFGAYKTLDFLAANAPTLGEAFRRIAAYFPLVDPAISIVLNETSTNRVCRLEPLNGAASLPRQSVEYTLAALYLRTRAALGTSYPLEAVRFAFAEPEHTTDHRRIFDCPLIFNHLSSEIVLSHETWSAPIPGAHPALFEVLEAHAAGLKAQLNASPSVVGQTHHILQEELRGGDPSLGNVAKRLAMSERTLQRRLEEAGTSFNAELEHMRRQMAAAYLKEPDVSIGEVAYLLCFNDQSSFSRAFKRWYDMSPSVFRKKG